MTVWVCAESDAPSQCGGLPNQMLLFMLEFVPVVSFFHSM